ncbi:hypothetical protein ACFX1X_020885 [Malus domestica]
MKLRASKPHSIAIPRKPCFLFGSEAAWDAPPCSVTSWRSVLGMTTFMPPTMIMINKYTLCLSQTRVLGTEFSALFSSTTQLVPNLASHLYLANTKFIKLDTELLRSHPLYITRESQADKYVPTIAYYLLNKN